MSYNRDLWIYNAQDCCYTFEIAEKLEEVVKSLELEAPHAFQQRLLKAVFNMMNRGIRYDIGNRDAFEKMLLEEIDKRNEWITQALGHPLNINSNKQMKALFYEDFKQPIIKNHKTQAASLDDKALSLIMVREPILKPLVKKIQELRSLNVFLKTFVRAPVDPDGRMRSSFNIAGTETFRFSSSTNAFGRGMNLQNIPKGGGDDELELPNIRNLFLPDPGYEIIDIDLVGADLQVVMWEGEEEEGKRLIRAGEVFYVMVAKYYTKDDSITKKHALYKKFKAVCHATHYLGSAFGIAKNTGLSVKEVKEVQDWYFKKFPGVKRYQDKIITMCKENRYVQNIFGNRWYIMDRIDDATFREAAAWIPQSTVALIISRGLVNIYENLPEVELLSNVHDSLIMQVKQDRVEEMIPKILEQASIELPYPGDSLTIPVDLKRSLISWGAGE